MRIGSGMAVDRSDTVRRHHHQLTTMTLNHEFLFHFSVYLCFHGVILNLPLIMPNACDTRILGGSVIYGCIESPLSPHEHDHPQSSSDVAGPILNSADWISYELSRRRS